MVGSSWSSKWWCRESRIIKVKARSSGPRSNIVFWVVSQHQLLTIRRPSISCLSVWLPVWLAAGWLVGSTWTVSVRLVSLAASQAGCLVAFLPALAAAVGFAAALAAPGLPLLPQRLLAAAAAAADSVRRCGHLGRHGRGRRLLALAQALALALALALARSAGLPRQTLWRFHPFARNSLLNPVNFGNCCNSLAGSFALLTQPVRLCVWLAASQLALRA